MAKSSPELIAALRTTVERLRSGARYEWGHMGRCNCGHLVQTVTRLSDREITSTINDVLDEWSEHARHRCRDTDYDLADIFKTLAAIGFSYEDVIHLENLTDPRVLKRAGAPERNLARNVAEDVAVYMETLATLLEEDDLDVGSEAMQFA